jgi:hypothetical protein
MAHSAFTLYELIDVTGVTEEDKSRHIEMPHFRQIPVDGINFGHTMSIYLSKMDKTEVILIKVSSVKYFQHTKRHHQQYKPVEHQMIVPTYAFARFIFDVLRSGKNSIATSNDGCQRRQLRAVVKASLYLA